jgi:hypothetical protein
VAPPADRWRAAAGAAALGGVALAIASGLVLAFWFDPGDPASVATLELTRPAARAARAAHAWSAHLALLAALAHALAGTRAKRGPASVPEGVGGSSRSPIAYGLLAGGRGRGVALVVILAAAGASGALLRGDAEAGAALIALERLGVGESLLHHALTLSAPALLLAAWRRRPDARALLALVAATLVLAWLVPPRLQAGIEPVRATRWGLYALAAAGAQAAWLPARGRAAAALALVVAMLWIALPRAPRYASQLPRPLLRPLGFAVVRDAPAIRGRPEGCVPCHAGLQGLDPSHLPLALGCAICHLGDPARPDAAGAHDGMLLVPGNLDSVALTCGRGGCHDAIAARVARTLMTTAVGLVAVNRFVFGEQPVPDGTTPIDRLGGSPADRHLAHLCSTCHLGAAKPDPAPLGETSRGGGCVACHLQETGARPGRHPAHTVRVADDACFGCHSRSGRISLNYAGWIEDPHATTGERRTLADDRVLRRVEPDVHHARGMACIDCHTAGELMGDGRDHLHEEQATRVRCATCHRVAPPRTVPIAEAGQEAALIVHLRGETRSELLVEDLGGEPLTNARPIEGGAVEIGGKLDGKLRRAAPPVPACTAPVHARVSCQACHSAWVPRCVGCHTQHARGEWIEYEVPAERGLPSLGLLDRDGRTAIEPFAPGMVLTINGPGAPAPPDPLPASAASLIGPGTRFVRAYALAVPHTTTRTGRSCVSCHLDPVALGYGKGRLSIEERAGAPAWRFEPAFERSRFDGLPGDAWIGFLADPAGAVATRTQARPLGLGEQRRVLAAGACLTCHAGSEPIFDDLAASRARRPPVCRVPAEER